MLNNYTLLLTEYSALTSNYQNLRRQHDILSQSSQSLAEEYRTTREAYDALLTKHAVLYEMALKLNSSLMNLVVLTQRVSPYVSEVENYVQTPEFMARCKQGDCDDQASSTAILSKNVIPPLIDHSKADHNTAELNHGNSFPPRPSYLIILLPIHRLGMLKGL
ncbi:MAG: hypothetical protein QW705_05315 [Zestosphaera sp.]